MSTENTDAPNVREMYRQLEAPQGAHLERCPICEAEAGLWQFSASRDAPVQRVVMCSHGDEIGPQDGIVNSGCLLYMPDEAFYQPTAREAIRYWNAFAAALRELRASNAPAADSQKSSLEQQLRAENERLRIAAEDAAERMEVWNFSSANDIARNLRAALAAPAAQPASPPLTPGQIFEMSKAAQDQAVTGIAPSLHLARAVEAHHNIGPAAGATGAQP